MEKHFIETSANFEIKYRDFEASMKEHAATLGAKNFAMSPDYAYDFPGASAEVERAVALARSKFGAVDNIAHSFRRNGSKIVNLVSWK